MTNNNEAIEALRYLRDVALFIDANDGDFVEIENKVHLIRKSLQPPEGYVLVPREPTAEMVEKARSEQWKRWGVQYCNEQHTDLYKAMIEAVEE